MDLNWERVQISLNIIELFQALLQTWCYFGILMLEPFQTKCDGQKSIGLKTES